MDKWIIFSKKGNGPTQMKLQEYVIYRCDQLLLLIS